MDKIVLNNLITLSCKTTNVTVSS